MLCDRMESGNFNSKSLYEENFEKLTNVSIIYYIIYTLHNVSVSICSFLCLKDFADHNKRHNFAIIQTQMQL